MWWKLLLAFLCGAYLVSPADLSLLHLGLDDIAALAGTIASITAAVNQYKSTRAVGDGRKNDL